ncbi:MAG: 3-dehydroquinate synthase [Phycisphaerales bacterium]
MSMDERRTIEVSTPGVGSRYAVEVGGGILAGLGERVAALTNGRRAMLVCDEGVPERLVTRAEGSLARAGFGVVRMSVRAREDEKSLETGSRLIHGLAEARLERSDVLVSLGGGIVGDVAGFASACYRRGIGFVQCPTTLLSMVDASVGGKTGVNLTVSGGMRKNLAGAFHQPLLVVADVEALDSLSARVFRAGLGECLKHGMIAGGIDDGLLEWTVGRLGTLLGGKGRGVGDGGMGGRGAMLVELVARNVGVKKRFVEADERETSGDAQRSRMLLNLGHTYAHALESVGARVGGLGWAGGAGGDDRVQHGEAVLLGLVAATHAAAAMGLVDGARGEAIRGMVESVGLGTRVGGLPDDGALIALMGEDKKASGGHLRVVLPDGERTARVVESPDRAVLSAGWVAIRG